MIHGKRWTYMKGCRCEPCRDAESAYKRAWSHRHGVVPGRAGIRYSRCGIRVEAVVPELETLVRVYGTQKRVAELLGVSESWVYRAFMKKRQRPLQSRPVQRVHLGMAQRIYELARGTRNIAEEDREREIRLDRERRKSKARKQAWVQRRINERAAS